MGPHERGPGRFGRRDGGERSVGELGIDVHLARLSPRLGLGTRLRVGSGLELKI